MISSKLRPGLRSILSENSFMYYSLRTYLINMKLGKLIVLAMVYPPGSKFFKMVNHVACHVTACFWCLIENVVVNMKLNSFILCQNKFKGGYLKRIAWQTCFRLLFKEILRKTGHVTTISNLYMPFFSGYCFPGQVFQRLNFFNIHFMQSGTKIFQKKIHSIYLVLKNRNSL